MPTPPASILQSTLLGKCLEPRDSSRNWTSLTVIWKVVGTRTFDEVHPPQPSNRTEITTASTTYTATFSRADYDRSIATDIPVGTFQLYQRCCCGCRWGIIFGQDAETGSIWPTPPTVNIEETITDSAGGGGSWSSTENADLGIHMNVWRDEEGFFFPSYGDTNTKTPCKMQGGDPLPADPDPVNLAFTWGWTWPIHGSEGSNDPADGAYDFEGMTSVPDLRTFEPTPWPSYALGGSGSGATGLIEFDPCADTLDVTGTMTLNGAYSAGGLSGSTDIAISIQFILA